MKLYFQEEEKKQGLNRVELPDDQLVLEGEFVEDCGDAFKITGVATIEGERYHDFEILFALAQEPPELTLTAIMDMDWEWYDFTF